MFTIKSYLQFRNTPDGKPRVLKMQDWVDANIIGDFSIVTSHYLGNPSSFEFGAIEIIAHLSDCRPLLTVEIDGMELRSLTVRHSKEYSEVYQFLYFDGKAWRVYEKYTNESLSDKFLSYCVEDNLYFFESDPAKYSKLLWNCSEQEGWQKVFKLLGIEL